MAECANGFEAVKAVNELKPDLLLLDIQMPKLDGFDVLELVGGELAVIFVTAYDSFALRAFEVHAVDYLLKPFGAERLAEALDRARASPRLARASARWRSSSRTRARSVPRSERILIRDRADVHVIPVEKIDYVESQDDYISVKVGGKSFLKEQTLGDLEKLLDPMRFVRIHRRYLLNISAAREDRSVGHRQPRRRSQRRHRAADQPRRLRAVAGVALTESGWPEGQHYAGNGLA